MADELEASVTETDATLSTPVDQTPDLSAGGETVTETPSVSAAPETPSEPQMRGLLDVMRERGYATSHENDADALQELIERAQRAQQYEPYVQHLQSNWTGYQQYLNSQQQPKPQQPAEAPKSYWDKLPEYDPNWLNMVQRNEQGQLVAVPGAQPDLPQKIQAYTRAREAALSKMLSDPAEAIWGGIEPKLNAILEQRERQIQERIYTDMQARQYLRDNAAQLFQVDQNGQYLRDPSTGQPAFSPYGQAFAAYMNQAVQMGIPTPQARAQYASNLASAWVAQNQPQPPPVAQPAQRQPNGLQAAARNPNRSGTEAQAGAANGKARVNQNKKLSVGEQLQQGILREYGSFDALEQAMAN